MFAQPRAGQQPAIGRPTRQARRLTRAYMRAAGGVVRHHVRRRRGRLATPFLRFSILKIKRLDTIWQYRIDQIRKPGSDTTVGAFKIATLLATLAWLRPVSRGNRHFTVDCGRLRQSGPRPETGFLRQPALEGLTRSARTDSPRQDCPETIFRRREAAAAAHDGDGGGGF
ncbi:hypothetical protein F511_47001 [Dorcoceras hygrometricum]|uniref:Uncharacterized protein n=1 Tax=Dorcoceras hygrometricum TaxID=472368 RepID=A0A2Z6ZS59_9LAMI|nr:hypothetical protein F511_47001 [Dorcoceras hygrometricum]